MNVRKSLLLSLLLTISATALCQSSTPTKTYPVPVHKFDRMVQEIVEGRLCDSARSELVRDTVLYARALHKADSIITARTKERDTAIKLVAAAELLSNTELTKAEEERDEAKRKAVWGWIAAVGEFILIVVLIL